ncbi:MAG: Ppx/GppA family phosphatase [Sulfurimonas sp.]|uniref:Ppx/GppA phosphatase family protein n=1 Tax=Sulfurimonas sp. TaxID=2022749 RepID=UPI0025EA455B|nr:Ppx/GppA phosphatase family protein [Sulfurimonas sp.]MCK9490781.1 Ppx/GppA family phosphatase [Sulfurimonas sp.]
MSKRVAVIDIGSNSIRLVVYEKTSRFAFHLLNESKSKVRLSQNAYQNNGNLCEAAMSRTLDTLRDFLSIIASYKARKTLCIATSALRDAPNKKEFLHRAKKELKLNIKIIDGQKEAYLGAIACANLLPVQSNSLTIDIGGGSTEFALINDKDVSNTLSLDLGSVRIKELFCDDRKKDEAISYIDEKLSVLDSLNASTLIGIGGTFRAVSSAILARKKHPLNKLHAFSYNAKELDDYLSLVIDATEDELKKLGIKADRFDVIKPGALILQRVLKKLSIKDIITSGVGVREGAFLADLLRNSKDRFPEHYSVSTRYILDSHISEKAIASQLNFLVKKIFDLTHKHLGIDEIYRRDLSIAAKLYPCGNSIHFYSKNKHSYYILQSALEYGFTHKQITLISTLCKYAKKKLPTTSHVQKYKELLPERNILNALNFILSLSVSLVAHRPRNLKYDFIFEDGVLNINADESLRLCKESFNKLDTIENLKVIL